MAWLNRPKRKDRRVPDASRKERHQTYNTTMWVRLRDWKRRKDPLCEVCAMRGKVTPGSEVHHIRSFMETGDPVERDRLAYDPGNLLTICGSCHHELHHGRLKGCKTINEIKTRLANGI